MLKRGAIAISPFATSTAVVGWCRRRRRRLPRRQKGGTIRLGNKKRRRFYLRCHRPAVNWGILVCPFQMLKKIIMDMTSNGKLMENCDWALPIFRPQLFPLC
ncbi:hypothetical protein RHMOL_Rhmol13G0064600 [Rhododendron molle]|uniref:Uncharacterized protein n=1 Tax=Rhododendron molle TaxID=49168 RepID=A0ACC0L4K6_RHOML|nr:hypothetical protein RHMOL_Rhmol13G0064600 [Rhododendron molle]